MHWWRRPRPGASIVLTRGGCGDEASSDDDVFLFYRVCSPLHAHILEFRYLYICSAYWPGFNPCHRLSGG